MKKKSLKFKISISIVAILAILVGIFFIYTSSYYKSQSYAIESLKSDSNVKVETEQNGDIFFNPKSNKKKVGFVFYPGAKVENSAYSPMAREIASKGYPVILSKMKFNLAILSPNKAKNILDEYPDINSWVIGGHSLGGVMASDYALKDNKIKGLVLLASYPKDHKDFTKSWINVLSLWGSNDKVADLNKVKNAKKVMPANSKFIEIPGGNHAGFGDYGEQKGDGKSLISNKEQINITSSEIIKFLEAIK